MDIEPNIDGYVWTSESIKDAELDPKAMGVFLNAELKRCRSILEGAEDALNLPGIHPRQQQKNREYMEALVAKARSYEKSMEFYLGQFKALREQAEELAAKIVLVHGTGPGPGGKKQP